MAGPSGPALVRQLQDSRVESPYVFLSGASDNELSRHGFDERYTLILRKPFTIPALLDAVSDALE